MGAISTGELSSRVPKRSAGRAGAFTVMVA
jgi:hypothetical protein